MNQDPAILRQVCFHPPFCPNTKCEYHRKGHQERFWKSKGWKKTRCYPGKVKCFQCKTCGRAFRYSYFKLEFREKIRWPGMNAHLFRLFTCGISNREISRQLGTSEHLVRLRLKRLFQWGILKHAELLDSVSIQEPIAYDGLENFAKSQYDPNHIQQAVGSRSLFIYDFNFAPLNRKGRMSERQKHRRAQIEGLNGRYHPRAIRTATREIIARLYQKRANPDRPFLVYSDEHFQYRRAIERDLKHLNIQQVRISSKEPRNFQNYLFPVNHSDLLIRQHVGAFSRETICFSKTHEAMIQKFALFMIWKNYFRSQYVKPHVRRPQAHLTTPAMDIGLTKAPLDFYEFFDTRWTLEQVSLNREWLSYYHEKLPYSRTLTLRQAA